MPVIQSVWSLSQRPSIGSAARSPALQVRRACSTGSALT